MALLGTTGHKSLSPHLKVLYQHFVQLKMFTIFRVQQVKVLHAHRRTLHPLPQRTLLQQCGSQADTPTQNA